MRNLVKIGIMFILPLSCMFNTSCNSRGKTFTVNIKEPSKQSKDFFNIDLDCTDKEMREHGYLYGDIVTVTAKAPNGNTWSYDLPYVTNYNEAGTFGPCLCDYESLGNPINVASGLKTAGIKENNYFAGGTAEIKMKKVDGYHKQRQLVRVTTKLTFEECGCENTKYANCRDVINVGSIAKKIKANTLFRGSSPICEAKNKGRYDCADNYLRYHGIENDISLSLTDEELTNYLNGEKHGTYAKQLYDNLKMFTISLGSDFFRTDSETPKGGDMIKLMFDYIANSDDESFFIHCNEGKDRTGFILMVIEALCGISLEDLVSDYMLTFCNYYNITQVNNKEKYDLMANLTCYRNLYSFIIEAENGNDRFNKLSEIDMLKFDSKTEVEKLIEQHSTESDYLQKCAEKYMLNIGCDKTACIDKIKNKFIRTPSL